ncbi:MAG TPA: hypothetical protein VEZ12_22300, partial [Herpetosiphonaceae bacterium]|nr:hypothetical protein [Herpetosiphonaceae bacterium]
MTEPVAQAGAQALAVSTSRLGVYALQGTTGARNIIESGPRLMQAFDPHKIPGVLQLVRDYKQLYSSGKVVLHVYAGTQDLHYGLADDPVASATDYWQKALLPAVSVLSAADRQLIDYISGPNEYNNTPPLGSAAEAEWVGAFWSRLADLIKEAGFRPNLGEIPVGHPDIGKLDQIMPALAPALRHIRSLDGVWSYHAYTLQYTTDPGVEIWYSLRYRQLYSYLRQHFPDLGDMPMILTETGVDERGDPATSGWKARGDAAKYKNWLTWLDKEIQLDPYLIGATIFQIGDSYWSSFDIEEISGWLAGYLSAAAPNLLQNPGFELDANADGRPDSWTSNSRFTRSSTVKRSGSYAGRFRATDNSGTTISQTIASLAPGAAYTFAGWVNIPSTGDAFTLKLEVRWRNASGSTIRTDTVKTYGNTSPQNVWDQATKSMVAPTGTTSAQVRMVVSSLNATIYVDDFVFQGASSPSATPTPAPVQTPTATQTPLPTTQVSTPTRTPA